MIVSLLALLAAAPAGGSKACPVPLKDEKLLLVVSAGDNALLTHARGIDRAVRGSARGKILLLPAASTERAMSAEGGGEARGKILLDARIQMQRAEDKFRELDDEVALSIIANVTTKLSTVQQEPEAIELSATAHLLAGAIYLARDRVDAARQRLRRALDLDPGLSPAHDRYSPRLVSELGTVRSAERPTGRLSVKSSRAPGQVYLDGRLLGGTPVLADAVGVGRHLLRVSAPGYLSYLTNVEITPQKDVEIDAPLEPDGELVEIKTLPKKLRSGADVAPLLSLLANRAGVDRAVLAEVVLGEELSASGTATTAVELQLPGVGRVYAASTKREVLSAALDRLLRCERDPPRVIALAPVLPGGTLPNAVAHPVPPEKGWYEKPWVWAVFALVAVGAAGGLVIARTAGGPPEAVDVTLVPRP